MGLILDIRKRLGYDSYYDEGAPQTQDQDLQYSKGVSIFSPVSSWGYSFGPSNYQSFASKGHQRNPYIFAALDILASSAAGLDLIMFKGTREVPSHPVSKILNNVNYEYRNLSYYDFMYSLINYLYLSGNAYIWVDKTGRTPSQIALLSSEDVTIDDLGDEIKYKIGDRHIRKDVEDIIHLRFFNPFSKVLGASPLAAVALSLDQNNAGRVWNASLMDKMTKTDGFITSDAGHLTEQQRNILKQEFQRKHGGANNAGQTMILPGGMKFTPSVMSPSDMDWENVMNMSGREISMALKIPAELLGFENRTYQNVKEAKAGLYSETILPQMKRILTVLNRELLPLFDSSLRIEIDMDKVDVLKRDRNMVTKQAVSLFDSGIVTKNEARKLLGYEEVTDGNVFKTSDSEENNEPSPDEPKEPEQRR